MSSNLAKYLSLSLFFISGGCIEEIVMDPGERAVVVECIIDNEDKLQTVDGTPFVFGIRFRQ